MSVTIQRSQRTEPAAPPSPKTSTKPSPQTLPTDLAGVALIDARAAAAAGCMSLSWWHAEVAAGRAPAPVIRRPRCTRWRSADVVAFWRHFGNPTDGAVSAETVKAQAIKASAAAQLKRRQTAAQAGA